LTEQIPEDLRKAGYAVSPFAVAVIIVGFAIVAGESMAQLPGGTPQAVDKNPMNPGQLSLTPVTPTIESDLIYDLRLSSPFYETNVFQEKFWKRRWFGRSFQVFHVRERNYDRTFIGFKAEIGAIKNQLSLADRIPVVLGLLRSDKTHSASVHEMDRHSTRVFTFHRFFSCWSTAVDCTYSYRVYSYRAYSYRGYSRKPDSYQATTTQIA
jgi:hypothetical protein